MKAAARTWLRYRADRRSLVFVGLTLLLLLLPLALALPPWLLAPWIAVSGLFCFISCIVNHNHVHQPVFHAALPNACFGIVLTLARGHSSAGVILAHNDNHHRYRGDQRDWIHTELAGRGIGILRLLRYTVMASLSMARGRRRHAAEDPPDRRRARQRYQRAALLVFALALVYYSGAAALLFVFLPWLLGMAMLVAVNLLQHDGCDAASAYHHSRNFTGAFGNWLCFNNGYHTIHHLHPELHWSELPRAHRLEVEPWIDAELEQDSILGFLFSRYVFCFDAERERHSPERF